MSKSLKSQLLCKYFEHFSVIFTTGLTSHMFFFLAYKQSKVKGDASGLSVCLNVLPEKGEPTQAEIQIQLTPVISNSLISNNRLSRSENLVPA